VNSSDHRSGPKVRDGISTLSGLVIAGVLMLGLTGTHCFLFETILHSYRKFESVLIEPTFKHFDCDFSTAMALDEKKKSGKTSANTNL
jgi:hypothetical protein